MSRTLHILNSATFSPLPVYLYIVHFCIAIVTKLQFVGNAYLVISNI